VADRWSGAVNGDGCDARSTVWRRLTDWRLLNAAVAVRSPRSSFPSASPFVARSTTSLHPTAVTSSLCTFSAAADHHCFSSTVVRIMYCSSVAAAVALRSSRRRVDVVRIPLVEICVLKVFHFFFLKQQKRCTTYTE